MAIWLLLVFGLISVGVCLLLFDCCGGYWPVCCLDWLCVVICWWVVLIVGWLLWFDCVDFPVNMQLVIACLIWCRFCLWLGAICDVYGFVVGLDLFVIVGCWVTADFALLVVWMLVGFVVFVWWSWCLVGLCLACAVLGFGCWGMLVVSCCLCFVIRCLCVALVFKWPGMRWRCCFV